MPTNVWGNATWLFFHVLVENVRQENFEKLKPLIIDIIKDTCSHLPCPYCAEDANYESGLYTKYKNPGTFNRIYETIS